jgi:hypothetical protein
MVERGLAEPERGRVAEGTRAARRPVEGEASAAELPEAWQRREATNRS